MLKVLLDEHVSPAVASGLKRRLPRFTVHALAEWDNGAHLGQDDASCLQDAARRKLTLVTYDRRTIPPLLKVWAESGIHHAGVVFVDEKTIAPPDIGGLVRALVELAKAAQNWDWTDRVCFLERADGRRGNSS
ncbi:MAG TPA: hypothetical protein VME23_18865 [Terracidiphilus sp.]|nr:hypothetical protein [Terracidiphilus sp.]